MNKFTANYDMPLKPCSIISVLQDNNHYLYRTCDEPNNSCIMEHSTNGCWM